MGDAEVGPLRVLVLSAFSVVALYGVCGGGGTVGVLVAGLVHLRLGVLSGAGHLG